MQYTYREIDHDTILSIDLQQAIARFDGPVQAYSVAVWDGDKPHAEGGELVIFDNDRFGFAWGADASWGDVDGDQLRFDDADADPMPLPQ